MRQGPPLTDNLRRKLLGQPLVPFHPQSKFLGLISTGDKSAVLSWGPLGLGGRGALGRMLWQWKDSLDRTWMAKYCQLSPMQSTSETDSAVEAVATAAGADALEAIRAAPMRCGGCGAKVGATVLSRVLKRLDIPSRPEVCDCNSICTAIHRTALLRAQLTPTAVYASLTSS